MTFNAAAFAHRSAWIFDVDYTLYGPEAALFEQVVPRITEFVSTALNLPHGEAREVQRTYYLAYGSTLAGMVKHHGTKPHEFTDFVHDIDYGVLRPNPALKAQIAALPGKKLILTNATLKHADQVLTNLGLSFDDFDGSFDVEMADWTPKPAPLPYERMSQQYGVAGHEAVFFEDTAKNLETARDMGWATAWVCADKDERQKGIEFAADQIGTDINSMLDQILGSL